MMIVILVVVVIWMVVMEVVVKEADEVTKEGIMYNFMSCNFGAIYDVFLTQFTIVQQYVYICESSAISLHL